MAKLLIDEKNVVKSYQTIGNGWSNTEYITVEVEEIPEYIKEMPEKYLYVGGEFVLNPDYVPYEEENVDYDEIALDHEFRISILELGV